MPDRNVATQPSANNYVFDMEILKDATMTFNKVMVIGIMKEKFAYNHIVGSRQEKFYKTYVSVRRKSETSDNLTIMASEKVLSDLSQSLEKGECIKVVGALCSHRNKREDGKNKLAIFILAERIETTTGNHEFNNCIYLEGRINKKPYLRKSIITNKITTDVMISVKRENGRLDYIPLIFWGTSAFEARELEMGDRITIKGRLHSRKYFERENGSDVNGVYREVNEVSVFEIVNITKMAEYQYK